MDYMNHQLSLKTGKIINYNEIQFLTVALLLYSVKKQEVISLETLTFKYKATKKISNLAHVGVVGSGDLEILMEPSKDSLATVIIRTRFDGYKEIWKNILDKFFCANDVAASFEINDFGATPGMISMRLLQALEVSQNE